jgi:hypothetical protein
MLKKFVLSVIGLCLGLVACAEPTVVSMPPVVVTSTVVATPPAVVRVEATETATPARKLTQAARRTRDAPTPGVGPTPTLDARYSSLGCQRHQQLRAKEWPTHSWVDATPPTPSRADWKFFRSELEIVNFTEDWFSFSGDQGDIRYLFEYPGDWKWSGGVLVGADEIKRAEVVAPVCLAIGQGCFDNYLESDQRQESYVSDTLEFVSLEDWKGSRYSGKRAIEILKRLDGGNVSSLGKEAPSEFHLVEYCIEDGEHAVVIFFWNPGVPQQVDLALFDEIAETVQILAE